VNVWFLGGALLLALTSITPATLRLSILSEPHSLLPILQTSTEEYAISRLVFDQLIEYDNTNQPRPDLAAEVPTLANHEISASGTTITMHLRRDVKWQDGVPFTSADVVFTINAILNPAVNVADRSSYVDVERVSARGPYTVVFHLKLPQGSFIANVAGGYPMLPAHLLSKSTALMTDPFNANPIGNGPYRFVRWIRGDRLEFAANAQYFRGPPKIGKIVIPIISDSNTLAIQIREHAIDFAAMESSTYNALRGAPGIVLKTEPLNDFNALAMNEARPILQDRRVRLALVEAIDRTRIARTVSFGTGTPAYADLPLFMYDGHPPNSWAAANPAAARTLLENAGWKIGATGIREKDGVPLHLELATYAGSASVSSLALQVQQMLRDVGVDIDYKSYDSGLYFSPASAGGPLSNGRYDLAIASIVGGNDPTNASLYTCASRIPAGFNYANYCSPEMERLQAAVEREYDPVRRNRIVAQIEALAVHDSVYVFLYHTPYRFAFDPHLVRPAASLDNRWYDVRDWTFSR
jgi:peptide/nickel transport system substrate-binding protein